MIAHLSGTLREKHVQRLVVDIGGVGYDVQVPLSTFYTLGEPGSAVSLRVHTHVREDAIQLFGFSTALELTLFQRLIAVNGIGPKVALSVLSGIEPNDFVRAIRLADVARLTNIPGVGKKTAERIVVELKDRLPKTEAVDAQGAPEADLRGDVLSALANLGYHRAAAEKALEKVARPGDAKTFDALLREVLKALSR